DASNVGLVSTEAQAFAGLKTFNNGLAILQSDTVTNPQAMTITNTAASNSLAILQNGNTGTTASSSGALLINNTGSTGFGLNVYTNQSTPAGALAFFKADHTSFNREVIRVDNDGTGPAIKINAN